MREQGTSLQGMWSTCMGHLAFFWVSFTAIADSIFYLLWGIDCWLFTTFLLDFKQM